MKLSLLPHTFAVCRLGPDDSIPSWIDQTSFWTVSKTNEELSVVCRDHNIPSTVQSEKNWKIIKVEGPLDFGQTGILASLANPLAEAKISIFAISTFDTDYLMVKAENIEKALELLQS